MNSDFTSKDTSWWLSGICIVLMVLIESSVDCSLRFDSSVTGFNMVIYQRSFSSLIYRVLTQNKQTNKQTNKATLTAHETDL